MICLFFLNFLLLILILSSTLGCRMLHKGESSLGADNSDGPTAKEATLKFSLRLRKKELMVGKLLKF